MKSQGDLLTSEISPAVKPEPSSPGTQMAPVSPTPLAMVSEAVQRGLAPEIIRQLMDLAERAQANDARNAFNRAFAAFKSEAVQIVKNVTVTDGPLKGKKYANLFAAVDAVTPALSKHGLSHSWKVTKDDPTWLEVTCILRHELGHSETVSMGGPPDTGGAKSPIQARASSKSYLERYTLLAITGLASSDGDDDGATGAMIDVSEQIEWIANAKDIDELQRLFFQAYNPAKLAKNKAAMSALIAAKDKRKGELL